MNKFKLAVLTLIAVFGVASVALPAYAQPVNEIRSGVNATGSDKTTLEVRIQDIVNLMLFILGAIAVIMIVIGGIRYTTSNGDSSAITSAKNTILYAVVGLIVAILAYAIVNFVLDAFVK